MKQHFVSHHPSSNLPSEYPQIQHLYSQQKREIANKKLVLIRIWQTLNMENNTQHSILSIHKQGTTPLSNRPKNICIFFTHLVNKEENPWITPRLFGL